MKMVNMHHIQNVGAKLMVFLTMSLFQLSAHATINMPSPTNPTNAPTTTAGNWLNQLVAWIIDAKDNVLALLMIAAIAGYAWGVIMEVLKIRREKEVDWGRIGVFVLAGAGLLLFVGFMVNEADTILT